MSVSQKISTCLWYDAQAEEAATLYVSLFANSRIRGLTHYGKGAPMPAGTVMTVSFDLAGIEFTALNGGPMFQFTEAASMMAYCDTQDEVDRVWAALVADGGRGVQCCWLKDRFGLSWQIIPACIAAMMRDPDSSKGQRAMMAMMKMVKPDIAALEAAFRGD